MKSYGGDEMYLRAFLTSALDEDKFHVPVA